MNAIQTTVQGNATSAASIYQFDDGGCRANVTIAVNDTFFDPDANAWKERKPEFVRVQVRRKSLAHNVAKSVRKGQPIIASGRLVSRTWIDRDGKERTELLLHADSVGIELTYGTAEYMKTAQKWFDEETGEIRGADKENTDQYPDAASASPQEPTNVPSDDVSVAANADEDEFAYA